MSTSVEITFPWGRYHATPWGHHVNEAVVEWPPSPWRFLRGLYATWLARAPHLPAETVHGLLSDLAEPPTFWLPDVREAHTRHFMPDMTHMLDMPRRGPTTSYSDNAKDKAFDAFAVFDAEEPVVATWPVDLDWARRAALVELTELLPYLGRAESICTARVIEQRGEIRGGTCGPLSESEPGEGLAVRVLVPRVPLDLGALRVRTTEVRGAGFVDPPGARWERYGRPRPRPVLPPRHQARPVAPQAVRWALSGPALPSVRAAVVMGEVLRRACMGRYGRRFDGAASAPLSGKTEDGRPLQGHGHAHFLAIDEDGDRLLDHLILWAPGGLDERSIQAVTDLDRLIGFGHLSEFRPVRLGLEALGPVEDVAPGLAREARTWRTITPFATARHPKRRVPWTEFVQQQVRLELGWRGLPQPESISLPRGEWLAFRRHRIDERLHNARRAVGVEIAFDRPVRGPLALGALSHFGLGLFLPRDGS